MARLVDASPPGDDRVDPSRWRCLARVCPDLQYLALFPADHHSLDHYRTPSTDSGAPAADGCLAWAPAGLLRRCDDHGRRVHDRVAGRKLHGALPAGDYCREHTVLAAGHVYHLAFLYFFSGVDGGACSCRKVASHFPCTALDRKCTPVVPH